VDLNELLKQVVEQEQPEAEKKGITLSFIPSAVVITILAELSDLEKAFINLVSNAIRYTLEGGRVEVKITAAEGNSTVSVQDTGIGIAEKDIEKIYQEFYRAENAKKLVNFGTGLGLSLVREIIKNHGGSIAVESKLEQGTTFTVNLPLV
jgi:signal transduction histidine kinase